jgi:hypothetical protein
LPKPIRVVDTRAGQTALYNGSNGSPRFTAGQTVTYTLGNITYGGYSIPAEAQVVVATIAAIGPVGQGFLTIYPGTAGATLPTISSLSYRDVSDTGVTSNTSYLNLGTGGVVNVYSKSATDLVMDISGYYAPAGTKDPNNVSAGLLYFPLPQPIRLLDTRAGATALYTGSSFNAGDTKNYTLNNIGYNGGGITVTTPITIPAAAKALVANTTVVGAVGQGYLTIYPGPVGSPLPTISSMNYRDASNTSSSSYPTLDGSGVINVYSLRAADLIMDVSGYFAPVGTVDPNNISAGLFYTPLPQPIRVLDTRAGQTALYSGGGQFSAGGIRSYELTNITYPPTGGYNIPATTKALVANTTVIGPAVQGFLVIYPGPAGATIPLVSSLNYRSGTVGATTSNPSHVTVSSLGVANIYSLRATDIVMDVSGYYVP